MKYFIIFSCIFVSAWSIHVTDCGSKLGTYSKVAITSCEDTPVCILRRKSNVTIDIYFTTNEDVSSMKAVVHGIIAGLPVPYPIPNSDACKESGLECPIKSGTSQHYTATFSVLAMYPKIKVNVQWELKTDAGIVLCMSIPTQIK